MYYKNNCFNDYRICLLLYIYNNSLKINNNPIAVINMDILSEKITKYYKDQKIPSNHELFTDPLFPPNTNSLLSLNKDGNFIDEIDGKSKSQYIDTSEIVWKRASEIFESDYTLFENSIEVNDVKQGDLGNCYFLSSLAALAAFPNLIYQLFKTKTVSIYGYYEIILCIDGEFQIVILDDYFPVEKNNIHSLKFAKPNNNEIWVLLIEKAWAKINGGYSNIIGGSPREALKALTNFANETLKFNECSPDEIYDKIALALKYQSVVCATTSNNNKNQDKGLLPNHAYTLLDAKIVKKKKKEYKLIKIRNPWGFMEWNGDWSDLSKKWSDELKDDLDFVTNDKDGIFYMELNDFIKFFIYVDICYIQYNSKVKISEMNHYLDSPCVYNLYVEEKEALVAVSLCKKYWRYNREMKNKSYPCFLLLTKVDKDKKCSDLIGKFESEEDVEICSVLSKGMYLIYAFYNHEQASEPKLDKFYVKVSSNFNFKLELMNFDTNCELLRFILLCNIINDNKNTKKKSKDELLTYTESDYKKTGIGYRAVINNSKDKIQIWDNSLSYMKNMSLLPPYNKTKDEFRFEVAPHCCRIILGMKIDKYSSFWFNLSSKFTDIPLKLINTSQNIFFDSTKQSEFYYNRSNDFQLLNESDYFIDSFDNVKMTYDYISLPLSVSSKSTMVIDSELEKIKMENAVIVRKIVSLCIVANNAQLQWKKITYPDKDYYYIGQYNKIKKMREGRGALVYNNKTYTVGYWSNDMRNGYGKEYDRFNFCLFHGNYVNDIKEGLGTEFQKKYNIDNNNIVYHGLYEKGLRNGFGVYYFTNGERWEGKFIKGKKHGRGKFYPNHNSTECYKAEFDNDKLIY